MDNPAYDSGRPVAGGWWIMVGFGLALACAACWVMLWLPGFAGMVAK